MTISELLSLISRNTNTLNTTTSSYTTVAKTLDINNALNQYFILANSSAGNWRPADDTNQAGYPVNVASLVSGQQDYTFTTDSDGNQILDIYKVRILNPDGINWTTLTQINQDTITDSDLQTVNSNTPQEYYLTANGIFLVQKPNYNMTNGLEIWVARSPVYFTAGDVATGTKVAGIPWVHQEYLALRPSYFYCLQKQFPQARDYGVQLQIMEKAIKDFYRDRNKDYTQVITGETINSI
jgi:hypothetical protein